MRLSATLLVLSFPLLLTAGAIVAQPPTLEGAALPAPGNQSAETNTTQPFAAGMEQDNLAGSHVRTDSLTYSERDTSTL